MISTPQGAAGRAGGPLPARAAGPHGRRGAHDARRLLQPLDARQEGLRIVQPPPQVSLSIRLFGYVHYVRCAFHDN